MAYHWLRNPKVIIFTPLILLLLFTVACDGTAAEPIVVEKEVVREVVKEVVVEKEVPIEVIKEVVVEKEVIRDVVKEVVVVATPIPVGAVSIAPDKFKLNRLIVAVAPLGFDSNYSYKTSSSGLLDKRLASEWLIDIDRNTGEYIPNLADSWEMAPNGKDWTFKLRKDVKWQGGPHAPAGGWGEFTANDVRHSLYLLVHPNSSASSVSTWRKMMGVGKKDTDEAIQQQVEKVVEIVDDNTFIFHANDVRPHLTYWFGNKGRNLVIESKARWDAIGHEGYGDATVGTGPMTFRERIEGVRVVFDAQPEHWRQVPQFKEFEFRWVEEPLTRLATLLTGEVHLSDIERAAQPEALARGMKPFPASKSGIYAKWLLGGLYWTEPEKLHPDDPFLNVKVRQAMNKAIDREAIVQALLPGATVDIGDPYGFDSVLDEQVLPGVINPAWRRDWDKNYGYDPDRAKELLAEAGYPDGFTIDHFYNFGQPGLPEMVDIAQTMALMLEKVGVKSNLENLETSAVRAKYRAHEVHNSVWGNKSQHPPHFAIRLPLSGSRWCALPELKEINDKLKTVVDLKERTKLIREAGDLMYYEFCWINMFGLAAEFVGDPKVIENYEFPGLIFGMLTHLEYMDLVQQ